MLIPYATVRRARRTPWVTAGIVGLNVIAYAGCLSVGPDRFPSLADRWGFQGLSPEGAYRLLTAIWIHDPRSFFHLHLLGNLWALIVFGPQVEDALGHVLYGSYYLLGGIAAGVSHALISRAAGIDGGPPMVGASGAVLCVLGVFAVRFYSTPVKAVFFIIPGIRLPAVLFLAIYLGLDIRAGIISSFALRTVGGVAHWAHTGGFLFGAGVGLLHGVVGHARREYLLERPIESDSDRVERISTLRGLVARDPSDAEARLRLATLLDADEATLPQAAIHYREAVDEFLRTEQYDRAIAAYDALREGGHAPSILRPRTAAALATALERAGRETDALDLLEDLSRWPNLEPDILEQALLGIAVLSRATGDQARARQGLERLLTEVPFTPWESWAKAALRELS